MKRQNRGAEGRRDKVTRMWGVLSLEGDMLLKLRMHKMFARPCPYDVWPASTSAKVFLWTAVLGCLSSC